MRPISYTVTASDEGLTVYHILRTRMSVSEAIIRHARRIDRGVLLDGIPSRTDARVKSGQTVSLALFDNGRESSIKPQEGPLEIEYEDEDILVINKPAGLVVHPSRGHADGTLCNFVAAYHAQQGGGCAPHPVNRLDRDTSGLIVFAKHAHMQNLLQEQLHTQRFHRTYLAACEGTPQPPAGSICAPIARLRDEYGSFGVSDVGKHAVTHYETIATIEHPLDEERRLSLVRLELETGRTHQIRVHLSHIGYPLLGDDAYGGPTPLIGRCALHSWGISLLNPLSGQTLALAASPPSDIVSLFPAKVFPQRPFPLDSIR